MVRRRWFPLALALGVAGCATFSPGEDNPARSLEAGLHALAAGDYTAARGHLDRAGLAPKSGATGRRALLIAALIQLDPRNPDRDLSIAAQRAAALQNGPDATEWDVAAGSLLAGLVEELEDARGRVERAELERHAFAAASILAGQSGIARVNAMTAERDSARRRVTQLEQTLAEKEKELREKTQELERIRRAIRG
jgi:hypothetical protein